MKHLTIETPRLLLLNNTPEILNYYAINKSQNEIKSIYGFSDEGLALFNRMFHYGTRTFSISFYSFILVNKANHLPIGECGFHTLNLKHKRAELFYHLHHDDDKQKGLMGEALGTVLQFGFDALNLHRVVGMVAPENTPSVKLLHKFGFIKEGTARQDYVVNGISEDSDCYSLLKPEWLNAQQKHNA